MKESLYMPEIGDRFSLDDGLGIIHAEVTRITSDTVFYRLQDLDEIEEHFFFHGSALHSFAVWESRK